MGTFAVDLLTGKEFIFNFDVPTGGTISNINNNLSITGTLEVQNDSNNYLYLGDKDTNGSWRLAVSGTNLVIQRRITGAYVTCSTITG